MEKLFQQTLSKVEVTLVRSGNLDYYTSINLHLGNGDAEEGLDFSHSFGFPEEVQFDPGETTQTVIIDVVNDTDLEGTETIELQLISDPNKTEVRAGEKDAATLSIIDNETSAIEFSQATYSILEDDTNNPINQLEIHLTRTQPFNDSVEVELYQSGGSAQLNSDFQLPFGPISFAPGENNQIIYLDILSDSLTEGTETLELGLRPFPFPSENNINNVGLQNKTTIKILDDETTYVEFGAASYTVNEGEGNTIFVQLTRTGDTTFESYVNLQAVDDNASLESDYTFNNLIYFAPGENNKSVEIELFNDLEIEATENFDLEITSGFGEDNYVVGTQYKTTVDIEDNSPTVEFGAASYTVNEGEGNTIVVQLTRTGDTTFESYVNLQAVDDNASLESDYTFNNLIYFAPGENNKSVEIELFNDREIEATENFDLEITSGFGEDNYVVGTQYKTTVEIEDNDAIIAEVGQITDLNNESQTILLNHNFVNPVIFAQPLSRNGGDSSTIRITDIQSNSFSVQLQETTLKNGNPHDGFHTTETFSFLVVEQGIWELSDGSILEAGNVATDAITTSTGESVDFNNTFANTPVVLTQVQTNNDTTFVRTRQRNGDANGFDFALEEEELYKASGHGTENVAWLAISLGEGNWDGNHFIAGNTGDQVTHNWHTIDFANNFTNAPKFLGNIATFDGPDSSGLRYRNLTNGNVQIMIEEDTSQDNEQNHTTEDINFLALEADGNLTGSVDSLTGLADSQAGTVNADIFVLGDASESFYDNYGQQDYAEISDFDLAQDIIQLHGLADDCYLGSSPTGIDDQGIFLKVAGMEDELVGVVKNTNTLDINSSNFAFV